MIKTVFSLLVLLSLATTSLATDDEDTVVWVKKDDTEFVQAYSDARKSFPAFEEIYNDYADLGFYMSVKVAIYDDDNPEYVWLSPFVIDGDQVVGNISNQPLSAGYSYGDVVTADKTEIYDWLALGQEFVLGAFTLKLSYQRMSDAEKAEFDKNMPQLRASLEQE